MGEGEALLYLVCISTQTTGKLQEHNVFGFSQVGQPRTVCGDRAIAFSTCHKGSMLELDCLD